MTKRHEVKSSKVSLQGPHARRLLHPDLDNMSSRSGPSSPRYASVEENVCEDSASSIYERRLYEEGNIAKLRLHFSKACRENERLWKLGSASVNQTPTTSGANLEPYESATEDLPFKDLFNLFIDVRTENASLQQQLHVPVKQTSTSSTCSLSLVLVGLTVFVAILGLCWHFLLQPKNDSIDDPLSLAQLHSKLTKQIRMLESDFPSQTRDMWPGIASGIRRVLLSNSTVPSMFLLLHNNNDAVSSCLARRVAQTARQLMNVTRQEALVVEGRELAGDKEMTEDRGRFVERYGPLVQAHGAMVLTDLQAVPSDLARTLHAFCDEVTPLVGRAIYIFTLNVGRPWQGNSHTQTAERQLNTAWHQLESDIRQPLIVRVTSGLVLSVEPEQHAQSQCR